MSTGTKENRGGRRKRTPVIRIPLVAEGDADGENGDPLAKAPLFAQNVDGQDVSIVSVYREDPDDGYQGRMSAGATEVDIKRKFGGGTYTVRAHGKNGRMLGERTFAIAGDPLFESAAAEAKWRRQQGLASGGAGGNNHAAPAEKPISIIEMMALMDSRAAAARADAEQAHKRELALIRADAEARRLEAEEREERRQKESEEREERREREATARQKQSEAFMATMYQITRAEGAKRDEESPVKFLTQGMELAGKMFAAQQASGGGAGDAVAELTKALPEIIREVRETGVVLKASSDEKKGKGKKDDEDVTLQGNVGRRARAAILALQKQGKDPAKVLGAAFDYLRTRATPAAAKKTAAPASKASAKRKPESKKASGKGKTPAGRAN